MDQIIYCKTEESELLASLAMYFLQHATYYKSSSIVEFMKTRQLHISGVIYGSIQSPEILGLTEHAQTVCVPDHVCEGAWRQG